MDFVGVNPKTGKVEKRVGNMDAARLFDKTAVFANTMNKITNDPQARSSLVSAFRSSEPDIYKDMLSFEISRRESAIKGLKDRTIKVENPQAYMAELQREVTLLQNNDSNTIGSIIFPRMQKVGREFVQSNTTRAYDRIESMAPTAKDKPDAIIKGINAVMDRAARDPKYYASILKGAGISSSGGYDPNKVLQAIGR
jgi:hemerythrin superfamily protein